MKDKNRIEAVKNRLISPWVLSSSVTAIVGPDGFLEFYGSGTMPYAYMAIKNPTADDIKAMEGKKSIKGYMRHLVCNADAHPLLLEIMQKEISLHGQRKIETIRGHGYNR